eukprot:c26837_g1_i2 orf=1017-1877(+)
MVFVTKIPVTVTLIFIHILVFLRPGPFNKLLPSWYETCLDAHLKDIGAKQMLLSTLFHVSTSQLVYDTLSLLWSGALLEGLMGSAWFACTIILLQGLSQTFRLLAEVLLSSVIFSNKSKCTVGFSGTLFALKVVLEKHSRTSSVCGLPLLLHLTIWAEFFFVPILIPGTSFTGHLCGILAGILYVYASLILHAVIVLLLSFGRIGIWLLWSVIIALRNLTVGQKTYVHKQIISGSHVANSQHGLSGVLVEKSIEEYALVWQCQQCKEMNGVFLSYCETCGTSRSEH